MKMAILIGLLSLATYLPRVLPALLIDSIHFSTVSYTHLTLPTNREV